MAGDKVIQKMNLALEPLLFMHLGSWRHLDLDLDHPQNLFFGSLPSSAHHCIIITLI